jgi:hypothetical protein
MDTWLRHGPPTIFVSYVRNISQYIRQLYVTNEYILIFFGTEKYNIIYSLMLYSLIVSSVNRGI